MVPDPDPSSSRPPRSTDSPSIRPGEARDLSAIVEIHNHQVRHGHATFDEEAATVEGLHRAVVGIALPNEPSVRLHRRVGFTEVGRFDEYARKHGAYISSVWFERRMEPDSPSDT